MGKWWGSEERGEVANIDRFCIPLPIHRYQKFII